MSEFEEEKLAVWPESLPPFAEMTKLPPQHSLHHRDLINDTDIAALVHDLFFFPEDEFYLYYEYGAPRVHADYDKGKLEAAGLRFAKNENYFYRRPLDKNRSDRFSYERYLPGDEKYEWQEEIIEKGPMYGRASIQLMEWKKKDIELERIRSTQQQDDDPLLLKPSIMGVGVDLKKLWKKTSHYFKRNV